MPGEQPIKTTTSVPTFPNVTNPYPYVRRERLEALEEIRQRVADGWTPLPADSALGSAPAWVHAHDWNEPEIPPEVAAVLWPSEEDATDATA